MRISKETSDILVIKDGNLIVFILGFLFALFGFLRILNLAFATEPNKMPISLACFFLLLGVFVLIVNKTKSLTFDKASNKLTIKSKAFIKKSSEEYDINKIKEVQLRQFYYNNENINSPERLGNAQPSISYLIFLILDNDQEIQLNEGSGSVKLMGMRLPMEANIAKKIAAFLNIPIQEIIPPTIGQVLSTVQKNIESEVEKAREENKNL